MWKNVTMLLSASFAAQAIAVLAMPVLSRLYDDTAFGIFQVYTTMLNVLLMVAALRYEMAILTSRTTFAFRTLIRFVVRLTLAMAIAAGFVAWVAYPLIIRWSPDLARLVYLVPATVVIGCLFHMLTYILIRDRRYRLSAQVKFTQATAYVIGAIALAFNPIVALGLVFADLLSRMLSSGFILLRIPQLLSVMVGPLRRSHVRLVAWQFRDYPLFSFPGTLMSALVGALVPLTLASLYDLSIAGQYALVERFILMPVGLVAASIAQVLTGDLAKRIRTRAGNLHRDYRQTVVVLTAMALPGTATLYLAAPTLVPFVFGSQWQLAGEICQIAAPLALIRFVAGPVNMVLIICDRQRTQLLWEVGRFVLTVALFVVVLVQDIQDPLTVMRWYVFSVVLAYGTYLVLVDHATARAMRRA